MRRWFSFGFVGILTMVCASIHAQTVDSFEPYSLVSINQHVSVVKDTFLQHKHIRVIKGNIYPRKDYADSNLYATIYVHPYKEDIFYAWRMSAHIGISFYRNRIFHVNYVMQVPDEYKLQGIYNHIKDQLKEPDDSSENVIHSTANDYHELTKPLKKFTWHGELYDIEFLFEKNGLEYQVEIVKINQISYQKYLEEVKVVEEQKTKMSYKKSRKVRNLNLLTLQSIYSIVDIVSDYKHYSYLEAILPSYTRTGLVFHKRKHDKNGIYWGYRDLDCKAYYMYHYDIMDKNPLYKKIPCHFKNIVVYCDADQHIFQIRIDFQKDALVSDIEPGILKTECTRHFDKNGTKGYYDLLQTVIVTLKHNDEFPEKAESMIISKEFLEYLVDMDE